MARFTAGVPLNIKWLGNEISGAAGATHRIPDALYDEFNAAYSGVIPGLTWVTQDEASATAGFDPATKYDKTGGTISGAVTVTGALIAQTSISTPSLSATNAVFKGSPWIDAKAYGAVGDGVTDDTASLQLAINALTAVATHATLFIPAGTYKVTSTLTLPYMQQKRILGAGQNASILSATMTNSPILKTLYEDTHTIEVSDLGLHFATQRSAANTAAFGIMFSITSAGIGSGFYFWRVSNVTIYQASVGIGSDPAGSGALNVWGCVFERIIISSVAYRGVSMTPLSGGNVLQTWTDLKIINNNTTVVATNYAFYASATELIITGLDVEKWHGPIFYHDGGPPVTIRGIHIESHTSTTSQRLFEVANGHLDLSGLYVLSTVVQSGAQLAIAHAGLAGQLTLDGARIEVSLTSGTAIGVTALSSAENISIRNITDANGTLSFGLLGQPFIGPIAPWLANASNAPASANQALLYAFRVENAVRVGRGILEIGTAVGSADLGIYDANGTRLASSGSFALSTGSQTAALTSSVLLNPGRKYFAAIAFSSVSAAAFAFSSNNPSSPGNSGFAVRVDTSFPLPSTITLGSLPAQRYYPVTFEP